MLPTHLDTTNTHASTSERPESSLATGTRSLGTSPARSPQLDVQSRDADLLAPSGDVLGGQHGGVGRRLVAVGLDLHAAGDAGDGLAAGEVGDVDEGVCARKQGEQLRLWIA